jgi:hypothetical protein
MGFLFADSNGLFYIVTEPLSESKYASMSGYKLWHQRVGVMGHCSHQSIEATIFHVTSTGLEELEKKKVESNLDCASCVVGKATLQSYQHKKDRVFRPLGQ